MSLEPAVLRKFDQFLVVHLPTAWVMRPHRVVFWGAVLVAAEVLFALLVPVSVRSTWLPERVFWWGLVPGIVLAGWWFKSLADATEVLRASRGYAVGAQLFVVSLAVMAAVPAASYVAARVSEARVGSTVSSETLAEHRWFLDADLLDDDDRAMSVLLARDGVDVLEAMQMVLAQDWAYAIILEDVDAYLSTVEEYGGALPAARVAELRSVVGSGSLSTPESAGRFWRAFRDFYGDELAVERRAQSVYETHTIIKSRGPEARPHFSFRDPDTWLLLGLAGLVLVVSLRLHQEMERPTLAVTVPVLIAIASAWLIWMNGREQTLAPVYFVPTLGFVSLLLATSIPGRGRARLVKGVCLAIARSTVFFVPLAFSAIVLNQLRLSRHFLSPDRWVLDSLFYQSVAAGLIILLITDDWFRLRFARLRSTPR